MVQGESSRYLFWVPDYPEEGGDRGSDRGLDSGLNSLDCGGDARCVLGVRARDVMRDHRCGMCSRRAHTERARAGERQKPHGPSLWGQPLLLIQTTSLAPTQPSSPSTRQLFRPSSYSLTLFQLYGPFHLPFKGVGTRRLMRSQIPQVSRVYFSVTERSKLAS